jgi:F-type H+-transporting ATPase subunit alpha
VLIFYAAVNHYIDEVPVKNLRDFENGLIEFMDRSYFEIGEEIFKTGELSEHTERLLVEGLTKYRNKFLRDIEEVY